MSNDPHIIYKINNRDRIIFVNDEWSRFALANDAPELVAEKILNRSLWNFIKNDTIQELYRKFVGKARAGNTVRFNFRCDSPDFRRLLKMTITLQEEQSVQFETHVIWKQKRAPQTILQKNNRSADRILIVCSWCNKINVKNEIWQEIEEAVENLRLFEMEELPQLSHGMCLSCYQKSQDDIKNIFSDKFPEE